VPVRSAPCRAEPVLEGIGGPAVGVVVTCAYSSIVSLDEACPARL